MIVLADGVFDPLHAGHLAYLAWARTLGDKLIVQVSPQRKRNRCLGWRVRSEIIASLGYEARWHEHTITALRVERPAIYAKGHDWAEKGIPADEAAFCKANGIQVVYAPAELLTASSTALLRSWAARTADVGVDAFDAKAQAQVVIPWDAAANGYTLENRRVAEGRHPDILAELCQGMTVLDYGCGPGFLVTMLRERGIDTKGYDPNSANRRMRSIPEDTYYDVVVCREVLEHVPVREYASVIYDLFALAIRYVYITTRFTPNPAHPFDLTDESAVDPSHITCLPQSFVRALCVTMGGRRCREWEEKLDWQHKGRVLVYEVTR